MWYWYYIARWIDMYICWCTTAWHLQVWWFKVLICSLMTLADKFNLPIFVSNCRSSNSKKKNSKGGPGRQEMGTWHPRSSNVQVLLDYLLIWDKVESISLTNSPDQTIWRWTRDGAFTTASAYSSVANTPSQGLSFCTRQGRRESADSYGWCFTTGFGRQREGGSTNCKLMTGALYVTRNLKLYLICSLPVPTAGRMVNRWPSGRDSWAWLTGGWRLGGVLTKMEGELLIQLSFWYVGCFG
jgi:hypothetical protein